MLLFYVSPVIWLPFWNRDLSSARRPNRPQRPPSGAESHGLHERHHGRLNARMTQNRHRLQSCHYLERRPFG